jgi:alpha-galactosidase
MFLLSILAFGRPAFCQSLADLRKADPPYNAIWLETLDISRMSQEWGKAHAAKSLDGNAITVAGMAFKHGVGTHAVSEMEIDLGGSAAGFASVVGLDDETNNRGSVIFEVWVDGRKVADSGLLHSGQMRLLRADLTGAQRLSLQVTDGDDGIDFDHADWAGAVLLLAPDASSRPQAANYPPEDPPAIASGISPKPAIHGPRIVGATPGRPFLFLIPATGAPPLAYSAKGLPEGLSLDPTTGIITGSIESAGTYTAELTVSGPQGTASRKLRIVAGGDRLALTPPMGWNSWYVWGGAVDADKVRAAADAMVSTGLAAHGYQYVSIDDAWEGLRDASGEIQPNGKFPDMKGLGDYVHAKGLKFGIYSSPGSTTCMGFEGSYNHESQDAETYAKWGVDLLKYDWCSYGGMVKNPSVAELQKPYKLMSKILDESCRDIVFSMCQYGTGKVWEWGEECGGNLWRTTGDIRDVWSHVAGIGFRQNGHEKFAGPGHWNDLDMLMVGKLAGPSGLHPTELSPNEQISQVTLWSLLSAPLLLSCDLKQIDQFTIDILTNDEVLDVDQDPLGKPAGRKARTGRAEVWARPLWDGTTAVGLFNLAGRPAEVTAKWSDLGLCGPQPVRDLWQQKDMGVFEGSFRIVVPRHGAALIKIGKPEKE